MKKTIIAIAFLLIGVLACQSSPTLPQVDALQTTVASTLQAYTEAAPKGMPSLCTFSNLNEKVSFVIPEGLANGLTCEVVPAVAESSDMPWWEVAPEHTRITLNGYDDSLGKFSQPTITIYPIEGYTNAETAIQKLQAILASPSAPLTKETLPSIPVNAARMIAAQPQRLDFASGSGVRMLTQYGQAVGPISNNGLFYSFQGLTSDGKYYVIASLPTGAPFLAYDMNATPPQPADGVPFSFDGNPDPSYYEDYMKTVEDRINATDAAVFQPSINLLDALVQSLTIQ